MECGVDSGSVDVVFTRNIKKISRIYSHQHKQNRSSPGRIDKTVREFEVALLHPALYVTSEHAHKIRGGSGMGGNVNAPEGLVRNWVF